MFDALNCDTVPHTVVDELLDIVKGHSRSVLGLYIGTVTDIVSLFTTYSHRISEPTTGLAIAHLPPYVWCEIG